MLKSYNELSRWYSALEPETEAVDPARQATAEQAAGEDEGLDRYSQRPARTPSDATAAELSEPEPGSATGSQDTGFTPSDAPLSMDKGGTEVGELTTGAGYPVEPEPEPAPAPPAELAARRSEFTGGWSDWVVEPAPGRDDGYDAELVQFPWPEAVDDEYDEARVLEPSGALRRRRSAQRAWIVLAVSVLVLVLAATGVCFLLFGRDTAKHAAPLHFTAGNVVAEPLGACPTEHAGTVLRSAEAGGTGSGPDAVLAFQHAYYVTRSGELARAVVAPDAEVSPAAVIQRGIDSIPMGTTHCVRITTVAENRYTVEVTEFPPAGAPATYTKQTVQTAVVGDRTLITGIAAG
ncbi:hypothetical protein [Nocardia rhizosphaerae]|uniref:DUF8176 domain-containing protein n=1 Tax=Nocardia rhizosphaerae TaxID=1691571 RepID=A0ABV8L7T8_9NOCA